MDPHDAASNFTGAAITRRGAVQGLAAGAVALADAYIGQRITVRRSDDRMQFSGVLAKGPQVVVE